MHRAGGTTFILIASVLALTIVILLVFEPWRDDERGGFRILRFEPRNETLARNEPIRIVFDRPVHPETPVEALIRVRDARGNRLPLRIERGGSVLSLMPPSGAGWPSGAALSVGVSPGLAVPFRARDHAALTEAVETDFRVGDDYIDFGIGFRLELETPTALAGITRGTVFRFASSLPIDDSALSGGRAPVSISVLGGDRGQRSFQPQLTLEPGGRGLLVTPWQKDDAFEADRRHRLTLHKGRLRAVTGRVLERDLVVEFRTNPTAHFEGQLDISFALADLDERSRTALGRELGYAEPILTLFNSVELGSKEEPEPVEPGPERQAAPWVFGRRPNRLQMLVPGSHLGDEPGLITGFAFFLRADPAAPDQILHRDLVLPRIVFRLGEASMAAGRGLLPDPDLNLIPGGLLETVAAGSHEGELVLKRRRRQGDYGDWMQVAFEEPFAYRGGSRDLVFEIVNDSGAFAADGGDLPEDWPGPAWAWSSSPRANPSQEARTLQFGARLGEKAAGIPSPAIFATKFHIERYQELVTRWYEVEAVSPTWFRVPAADQMDADGVEGLDFVVDFQGLDPEGRPGPWTRLDDLSGCRKIRARLRFLPDADWRITGVQVRRLRVRFRDGR